MLKMGCNCGRDSSVNARLHFRAKQLALNNVTDPDVADPDKLYVRVVYVVDDDVEGVDLDRIRAQHAHLNKMFHNTDMDYPHEMPRNPKHDFRAAKSNANVYFRGWCICDEGEARVYRMPLPYALRLGVRGIDRVRVEDQLSKLSDFHLERNSYLLVVIANLADGLLGNAYLFEPYCVIDARTVGAPGYPTLVPSSDPMEVYGHGSTLVHEVGHCFGLPHVFNEDGTCTGFGRSWNSDFGDIPSQRLPNFTGSVVEDGSSTSVFVGEGDNRSLFCRGRVAAAGFTNTCLSSPGDCDDDAIPYEQFMNIMDYGDDFASLMFSDTQARFMRNTLENDLSEVLETRTADQTEDLSTIGLTAEEVEEIKDTADNVLEISESQSSNGSMWWVILVVVIVLLLLYVASVAWRRRRTSRPLASSEIGSKSTIF